MAEVEYSVYFVPVPIGNRADVTLRALDVLRKVDVIACEDTRHSGLLLSHYEIRKPLMSMHDHNEQSRAGEIAARAAGGESFAVISDAGMPGVSDPGYRLIQTLKEKEVSFTVLPGPSAVVTALVGSGLPTRRRWKLPIPVSFMNHPTASSKPCRRWRRWTRTFPFV